MIRLEGITWNHTRGYVPKVVAAQRFTELHPEVDIRWSKRSLLEFGEFPVEQLAERFDLLVIDHPYIGAAAGHAVFQPLDDLLPAGVLDDLAQNSVGASHRSYRWRDRQWALAVDAACPVAHWRPDLLERAGVPVPETWDDVQTLLRQRRVLAPLIHTDAIHAFYMFCHALGEAPFSVDAPDAPFVTRDTGLAALELCRELAAALPPACLAMNPIAVLETLARTDDAWYCPFAFGYNNYARPRYAPHLVRSGEPVRWRDAPLITTLGGTGIAISRRCPHREIAARFAAFLASGDVQAGLCFDAGGQPAHRAAWLDERVNRNADDTFRRTLPALDRAWLRPRYAGYLHFQDHGAHVVADCLAGRLTTPAALDRLEALDRESRAL